MQLEATTRPEAQRKPVLPATEASAAGSGHVLVVDDSPIIRELLCLALQHQGFVARCAADGPEALALMELQRPDAVVCDLHMPEMDGLTLLRHVREHPRLARVPLLMLTVESAGAASVAARAAGASAFMSKPFRATDVVSAVRRLLADSRVSAWRA